MRWTNEQTDALRRLWGDGLSASQIAAVLGDVTRNAVIGKVHRMNLSGRAKPAAKKKLRSKARAAHHPRAVLPKSTDLPASRAQPFRRSLPPPSQDTPEPANFNVSLMEITDKVCKWPHGDPRHEDFGLCGHEVRVGFPYCDFHVRAAYQSR